MMTLPRPGAPPNSTGQRGHRAHAASGAPAPRSPAPVRARGARLPLWDPGTLIFVVFAVLWPVLNASAMTTGQDRDHEQLAAPQKRKHSLSDRGCPPGSHVSEDGEKCITCVNGVDYTIDWNELFSCLPCTICKSGQEETVPCTRTKNTQCQCKLGTFLGEDSPEFCQKCSTGCPDGMVEAEPCTPWSDLKCDKQESGSSELVLRIVPGTVCAVLLLLSACACYHWRRICQACGVDPECVNTVIFRRSCPPRGPGAVDNSRNEIISNRNSLSTLASEQELGHQEPAELEGVLIQSPVETEHLLGPGDAEGSQARRRLLIPANDTDPNESLRLFFDYFTKVVPYVSWNPLMRLLGLDDNDICVARAQFSNPREAMYEMLVTWLSHKGRAASVNTLLDALETLEERRAKESIQDHLVDSGKYVYEEDGAGSALS
ncbi:tumor necrosis factor receptor superfamily member 10B isoform X2 [Rhinolophus sinicus]|uniref:tumor necrosis factor receptor superfamily member 10B isoform X2 n=1 Tax=Rhinolophus sinicus TaxID=89399 RepID=UPI003D79E711